MPSPSLTGGTHNMKRGGINNDSRVLPGTPCIVERESNDQYLLPLIIWTIPRHSNPRIFRCLGGVEHHSTPWRTLAVVGAIRPMVDVALVVADDGIRRRGNSGVRFW